MAQLPADPENLRLAIAAALGIAPDQCDQEQTVDAYCYALARTWNRMEAVVGAQGARAIVLRGIKVASRRHPEIAMVSIGDQGLDLARLEAASREAGSERYCLCLKELYVATFQTIRELTGEVVVGPLLDEMRERRAQPGAG